MARSVPKGGLDDETEDCIYSNTRDIAAGTVGSVIPKSFYKGEDDYRLSKYYRDNAPTPDHMTRDAPGYMFLRPYDHAPIVNLPFMDGMAEDDVDMTNIEDAYETNGFYPRFETIMSRRGTKWFCDPNWIWDHPGVWYDTYMKTAVRWKTSWTEFPDAGVDLVCINPRENRWEWEREACSLLKAGDSIPVVKNSSGNNYIVSVYADLTINGQTYPAGKYIKITSEGPITLVTEGPTVIVYLWKKDNVYVA